MRIAQAVLAEVLPGAGDEHHFGAVALRHVVKLPGDAGRQGEVAADRIEAGPPRFAVLSGQRRAAGADYCRRQQGKQGGTQDAVQNLHHRILSL